VNDTTSNWANVALLTVWNPRLFPRTIEEHVAELKAAPTEACWTWWGRIYLGKKSGPALLGKWPWLEALQAELCVRPVVMYATSFDALHALLVDKLVFDSPDDGRVPAYYREQPHVALWFRVRDIRALHWNSFAVATALEALRVVEGSDGPTAAARPSSRAVSGAANSSLPK